MDLSTAMAGGSARRVWRLATVHWEEQHHIAAAAQYLSTTNIRFKDMAIYGS